MPLGLTDIKQTLSITFIVLNQVDYIRGRRIDTVGDDGKKGACVYQMYSRYMVQNIIYTVFIRI